MERCCDVAFDLTRINDLMLLVRDDLSMTSRGVAWCRYESGKGDDAHYDHEKVCIDFKDRRDFLHSHQPQLARGDLGRRRELPDARRGAQAVQASTPATPTRTPSTRSTRTARRSAAPTTASAPSSGRSGTSASSRVVWVAQGCEDILDEDDPHLDLQNFFPVPEAGLRHGAARLAGAGAGRDAVQGPARGDQPADRPHPRAE